MMPEIIDLSYPAILGTVSENLVADQSESRALLEWYLENFLRLDKVDAQDAICDGIDDRGIDGIYIDHNLESITVLQSKLVQSDRTIGDTSIKEFYGTVSQFGDPKFALLVAETTGNRELQNLIVSEKIPSLLESGYIARGIFVTNAVADDTAERFADQQDSIILHDRDYLLETYIPTGPNAPIANPVTFDVTGFGVIEYRTGAVNSVIAPMKATDLVMMDGLATSELFAWNVRQALGKTKVNKAIEANLKTTTEHKNFLLYHNGLTILCEVMSVEPERITISDYSVVNGAQSLTTLYQNRMFLTDELRLLTRIVQIPADSDLAGQITYHSNNQNPINSRDLQSNSRVQRRLQTEFNREYAGRVYYRIKRGELDAAERIIENMDAGKMLLAFDLEEPWSCHQSYKIFDDSHARIFARPEVSARRIYVITRILRHPNKEGKMEIRESSFFAKNGAIQADFSSFLCQNRHVRAHW